MHWSSFWFNFFRDVVSELPKRVVVQHAANPLLVSCCTGKEMTRLSTWWAASPSCPKVKRTCCCGTERTTSASCTLLAKIARSSGLGRPPSSITVPVGDFYNCTHCHEFQLVLILLTSFFITHLVSDCRPNCKVGLLEREKHPTLCLECKMSK